MMADHYDRIIRVTEAMVGLAYVPASPSQAAELHHLAMRIRLKAPRDPQVEIDPFVFEKVDELHFAVSREDVYNALSIGHILLDALPGTDDPKPKRPW